MPRHNEDIRSHSAPINQEKIEALIANYAKTGVWPNIEARPSNGNFEIAYGHHRILAAKRHLGEDAKIPVVVREMTEGEMLQKMADENNDTYGSDASVIQETIRAVVVAFFNNHKEIKLAEVPDQSPTKMIAPSFIERSRAQGTLLFTANTVAVFLGWMKRGKKSSHEPQAKVKEAIRALRLIDEGTLSEKSFEGVGTKKARVYEFDPRARAVSISATLD